MNAREEPSASDAVRAEFGRRMQERRKALGLSQRDLGNRLHNHNGNPVSVSQISLWERGEYLPSERYWPQLSAALDTDFEDLLSGGAGKLTLTRLEAVEEKLDMVIRLLHLEDAVAGAMRAKVLGAGITGSPAPPGEAEDAAEIARSVEAAERHEQETAQHDGQERGQGGQRSRKRRRPTGS